MQKSPQCYKYKVLFKAYQFSWSVLCCAEWFLYTIRLGQGLGSCNVSVSSRIQNISVSSRTKCPTSRSRTSASRVSSRSQPERSCISLLFIHQYCVIHCCRALARVLPETSSVLQAVQNNQQMWLHANEQLIERNLPRNMDVFRHLDSLVLWQTFRSAASTVTHASQLIVTVSYFLSVSQCLFYAVVDIVPSLGE